MKKTREDNDMSNSIGAVGTYKMGCDLLQKSNKTMTWLILYMRSSLKIKWNDRDWLEQVLFMMKTRLDNDVTRSTNVVYIKNETELSWLIKPSVVYD